MNNSNKDVKLCLATEADIDMMVDMRIWFADDLIGKQPQDVEDNLRQHLRGYFVTELNKTYFSWYATVDEQVVAIAGIVLRSQPGSLRNPTGKWGYIMNVFTLPLFRKRGISSMLLRKLMEHATELGITAFELHATKEGEPTYQKNGFVLHGEPTYRKFI